MSAFGPKKAASNVSQRSRTPTNNHYATSNSSKRHRGSTGEDHELQTTPEFRAHISNKLGNIIQSHIKLKSVWSCGIPHQQETNGTGIKLFRTSKTIHEFDSSMKPQQPTAKRKTIVFDLSSDSSDAEENEMLASVAVSGEKILEEGCLNTSASTTHSGVSDNQTDPHCADSPTSAPPNQALQTQQFPEVSSSNELSIIAKMKSHKKKKKRKTNVLINHE